MVSASSQANSPDLVDATHAAGPAVAAVRTGEDLLDRWHNVRQARGQCLSSVSAWAR